MKIFLSVASGILDIAQRRLLAAAGREPDVKRAWLIHMVHCGHTLMIIFPNYCIVVRTPVPSWKHPAPDCG